MAVELYWEVSKLADNEQGETASQTTKWRHQSPGSMTSCGYLPRPFRLQHPWSQDKDASVVHVTFLEAPRHGCWELGTGLHGSSQDSDFSLSAQRTLSLLALCKPLASRKSYAIVFHVPCRYWAVCLHGPKTRPISRSRPSPTLFLGPSPLVPDDGRSGIGSTRCSCIFPGHLHVGTFLLPTLSQFHLSDHARARPSFRCQHQTPRLQRLSLPCRPRGYPRNTPWAVVPDPIM